MSYLHAEYLKRNMDSLVMIRESHLHLQKHFREVSVDVKLGITQPGPQPE